VIPGFNGELLFDNIVENAVRILSEWQIDQDFQSMQVNIQKSIIAGRSWKKLINNWDNFFELFLAQNPNTCCSKDKLNENIS
jgi:hypothetical protein